MAEDKHYDLYVRKQNQIHTQMTMVNSDLTKTMRQSLLANDFHCVQVKWENYKYRNECELPMDKKEANKPPKKRAENYLRKKQFRARQQALKEHGGKHNLPTTPNIQDASKASLGEDTVSGMEYLNITLVRSEITESSTIART
ncbi:hypothetical protein JTB14_003281 [Gonioctena quinquepunctata]|nr:hypothetical protein JTB14_003281 [Gonioctena quinquepunctata]